MIGNTFYFPWEITLMVFLQSFLQPIGSFISAFSFFGDAIFLMFVIGLFYWCIDKEFGKTLTMTVGMGLIFNNLLKNFFLRRRPYFDHSNIKCISPAESEYAATDVIGQGFSYPSSHAVISSSLLISITNYIRKRWFTILVIVCIFLVGLSRVYNGVHYPTDVIFGWVVGLLVIAFVYLINSKIKKSWVRYLIFVAISLVGLLYCQNADYFRSVGIVIGAVVAFLIEENFVHFENTKNIKRTIIRFIGGLIVCGVVLIFLTLIFPSGSNPVAYIFRGIRYALLLIVGLGLYPIIFKRFDKYFND